MMRGEFLGVGADCGGGGRVSKSREREVSVPLSVEVIGQKNKFRRVAPKSIGSKQSISQRGKRNFQDGSARIHSPNQDLCESKIAYK